jgi:long-chain acyl-CoA synthetase
MRRDTLIDVFRDLVQIRGDFLVYDDGYRQRTRTYEELGRAARGFAARVRHAGLQPDDKVVFWGENRPEWIACYWGCLLARVIVVPIDYRSSAEFVEKVYRLVDARALLVGEHVQPPEPPSPAVGRPLTVWAFADLDWSADGPMPDLPHTRDDIIQIIFTSGATGEPKGVVIRHRNVLANTVPIEREVAKYRHYARPFHPIRFLNLLPLSHMFGQSMATGIPPMVRGTVIFTHSFNPHEIIGLVKRRRISVLVC